MKALLSAVMTAMVAATLHAAEPVEEARVRQTVLALPTNIDTVDFVAVGRLLAETVSVDYSSLWGGEARHQTREELLDAWKALVPGFDATWHEITNIAVLVNGDTASASSDVDARHWLGDRVWRPIGRYTFRLVKHQGRWLISGITLVLTREDGSRSLVEDARARAARR